ncbi:Uncharacterised protein [Actinobacillus pleuropneumoniae]|nr:Uncharacterised protein [Actinobacillus pleuropneumoniae]
MPRLISGVGAANGDDGTSGEGYFRAEYVIQLTTDQVETESKMQILKQGGGLK